MTKEDKKERRELRHKLQSAARRHQFSTQAKVSMTPSQILAASRSVADQIISGKDTTTVQIIP